MKVVFLLTIWVILFGPIMYTRSQHLPIYFTTVKATKLSYMMFMRDVRFAVFQETTEINGIPVLPLEDSVPSSQRFIQVQLSNWAESTIVVAIDVTNLYVVAYRTSTDSYFLSDAPDEAHRQLFRNQSPHNLTFGGSYGELQRVAGTHRRDLPLGITELDNAISRLHDYTSGGGTRDIARAFLVCIQMISEAARFRPIEQMVSQSISQNQEYSSFNPNPYMLSLENSWGELSTSVQSATSQTGSFDRTVVLQDDSGSDIDVNTVRQIFFTLAVMKFICQNRNNRMQELVQVINHVHCPNIQEPTVLIRGRNNMCVDVRNGEYNDGNSIIIFPCGNNQVNQLWTFKTDGTIRSNGKCLTVNSLVPGSSVLIFDCNKVASWTTKWELWSDGTISKTTTRHVLTAVSGTSRAALTVQINAYNSSQGWFPIHSKELFERSIVGLNDLCLHTDGSKVWSVKCNRQEKGQRWALYPDGTIRPQNRDHCLVTRNSDKLIIVSACTGWDNERWVFENNGTIRTLYENLVLDVKQSDTSLKQIIAYRFTGNPNQIWYLMP